MKSSTNTHDYDSHVKVYYKELVEKYNAYSNKELRTLEETKNEIMAVLQNPKYAKNKIAALNSLSLIINSHSSLDTCDNIDAKELLVMVWSILCKFKIDELDYFVEQLSDIITRGRCVQGQTKRLMQVLACLVD